MIIYYSKKTGDIFGMVHGRIHEDPQKKMIRPGNIEEKDIGIFIVPFKKKYREVQEPVGKLFLDKTTGRKFVKMVGFKIRKDIDGIEPNVLFSDLILKFESGEERVYDYKVIVDKNDNVTGFKKNV